MGFLDQRAKLSGRKGIVIGGGGGIGKTITLALVEAEVDVAFCDIDAAAAFSHLLHQLLPNSDAFYRPRSAFLSEALQDEIRESLLHVPTGDRRWANGPKRTSRRN